MSKLPEKFCHISSYLERTNKKLNELINGYCASTSLRPRFEFNGVTFIIPDKDTIKKLETLLYKGYDEGAALLNMHIIQDYLPTPSVWNQRRTDIPTVRGMKIGVKDVVGNTVTLVDGTVIEPVPRFVMARYQNQAIYTIKKGKIDPTKHTERASFEFARRAPPGAKPGATSTAASKPKKGGGVSQKAKIMEYVRSLSAAIASGHSGNLQKNKVTPYGFLVDFYHFVVSRGDDAALGYMGVVLSPLPISSMAFILRDDSDEGANFLRPLLEDFVEACSDEKSEYGKNLYGYKKYMEVVNQAQAKFHQMRGGATLQELNAALNQIITACHEQSKQALAAFNVDITPDLFTNLNLARFAEYNTLMILSKNQTLQKQDILEDLASISDVIMDRANGKSIDTNRDSQSLGIFIGQLLALLADFGKSPFAVYPTNQSACKDINKKTSEIVEKYNDDNSAHSILSKIDASTMSDFMSKVIVEV